MFEYVAMRGHVIMYVLSLTHCMYFILCASVCAHVCRRTVQCNISSAPVCCSACDLSTLSLSVLQCRCIHITVTITRPHAQAIIVASDGLWEFVEVPCLTFTLAIPLNLNRLRPDWLGPIVPHDVSHCTATSY